MGPVTCAALSTLKLTRSRILGSLGLFVALAVGVGAAPQSPAQQSTPPKSAPQPPKAPDYPSEPFVLENVSTKVVFENDGTFSLESSARILIQSQAGLQTWGTVTVPYPSAQGAAELVYARALKPDGRVVETPSENVIDMPAEMTQQAPFYSDLKELRVTVKGLEIGDTLEYQCRQHVTKPIAPGRFWYTYSFFEKGIALDEELQISVPRDRYVKYVSPEVQPTSSDQGAYRVYTWKTAHLVSKADDKTPTPDPEDVHPSVQLTTFRSWDEVGAWFESLFAPRIVVTPEIQAKADELTRGAQTDAEKIQAIYNFVSTKFRYVGIVLGIGRYQPHAASDVLTNDYGDCKDKHALFAALLAAEHIKAYGALIHSTVKTDQDIPYPGQFDHVITALPQEKGFLFLDTTPEVAPFGFLVEPLRDKKALVINDQGSTQFVDTPADPPFKSYFLFNADATLSDAGTLESKMHMELRGDPELLYRLAFRQAGQPQWNDVMQRISSGLGFGGTVSDVKITSPDDTSVPFQVDYRYERKDYGDWDHRRIFPPFPQLFLPAVPNDADKNPKPIKLGTPFEYSLKGTIKLPPNSDPALPDKLSLHEFFASYEGSCSAKDGVMACERRLSSTAREVPVGQIEAYRKFQQSLFNDVNTFIPLVGGSVAATGDVSDLVGQARQSWESGDIAGSRRILQRAIEKDPKSFQAWSALVMADIALGQYDKAKEELKTAAALDTTHVLAYQVAAGSFAAKGRDDDALDIWRQLAKANPDDADAPRNIAAILIRQKKYSEAIPMLELLANGNYLDSETRVELGQAYLHTGNPDKAADVFDEALGSSPKATTLNDVAYYLADANVDLENALKYAQQAVAKIEDDASDISLDNLLPDDPRTIFTLTHVWDTLGWVHFRMGHLDLAEDYLNAAWSLSQSPVIADHLGQVYEKEGKKHEAAVAYAHALSAISGTPEETRARWTAVRTSGKDQSGEQPDPLVLQDLRTFHLGKLIDGRATAEFFVLFGPDSASPAALFIKGSDKLLDAGKKIEKTNFHVAFPKGSSAHILRRGILDCEPETQCLFVLLPPESVQSIK
jgi:tetratricopeptide (TPR) repeat protein/transglutaminase-like putative cysteine protease